jgi:rhodanese-related sulfurtransferase
MKKTRVQWMFVALMAGMLLMATSCEAQPNSKSATTDIAAPPGVQMLTPEAAEAKIAQDPNLQVLDVRTPEEIADGVIEGAMNINWFDANFAAKATQALDKGRPVLVYCKLGGRSAKAADVLIAQGFASVFNLDGGITRWEAENHPLQK